MTPLHIATLNGNHEIAEYLIEKGANVNSKDNEGKTAMHYAALSNNVDLIKAMIEQVCYAIFGNISISFRTEK